MPSRPCILIIDDNPINVKLITKLLSRENYKIICANNGDEGYNIAILENPDLILLDVMMPLKDGYEVCKLLKSNKVTDKIPIIFLSAKAETSDKIRGLDMGAVDYITKPFNNIEVMARVRTQLKIKKMYEENLAYQKIIMESQKMASIGILSQGIAHNFNNLLSIIACYSQMLINNNIDRKNKKYVEKIIQTYERMNIITKDLLEFSQRQKVMPEDIIVNNVIKKSIDLFKSSFPEVPLIEIEMNLQETDKKAFGDQKQLCHSILNIFLNAREAMTDGGKITINSSIIPGTENLINKTKNLYEFYFCISIKDTGKGMKKEDMEKIFLPFYTTKNTVGVGLGLSIAYSIIENHEGLISVESSPGEGSTFYIYLPIKS